MLSMRFRAFLLCIIAGFTPYTHPSIPAESLIIGAAGLTMGGILGGIVGFNQGCDKRRHYEIIKTEDFKRQEVAKTEEAKRREIACATQILQDKEAERKQEEHKKAAFRTLLTTVQHDLSQIPDPCTSEQLVRFARGQAYHQWPVLSLYKSMQTYKDKLLASDPKLLNAQESIVQKQHLHKIEMILGVIGNNAHDILQHESKNHADYKHMQELNQQELENKRRDGQIQQKHLKNQEKLEGILEYNKTFTQQYSAQLTAQATMIDRMNHENRRAHEDLSRQIGTVVRTNVQEGVQQAIKPELDKAVDKIKQTMKGHSATLKKTIQEGLDALWERIRSSMPVASSRTATSRITPMTSSATLAQNTPATAPPASNPAA